MESIVKPINYEETLSYNLSNKTLEFELPIVQTEYSLRQVFKEELKQNADEPRLDLGKSIPIYRFNIKAIGIIERNEVIRTTQYFLKLMANVYKWLDDKILVYHLEKLLEDISKKSIGYSIPNTDRDYFINQAITEKDTIEIKPNKTIRFLKNPNYKGIPNDDSENHNEEYKIINKILGKETKAENYNKIKESIADYDLDSMTMYQCVIAQDTGLSTKTIQRYLKDYPELNEMYSAIKNNSGTKEQQKIRKKYKSRKVA